MGVSVRDSILSAETRCSLGIDCFQFPIARHIRPPRPTRPTPRLTPHDSERERNLKLEVYATQAPFFMSPLTLVSRNLFLGAKAK